MNEKSEFKKGAQWTLGAIAAGVGIFAAAGVVSVLFPATAPLAMKTAAFLWGAKTLT